LQIQNTFWQVICVSDSKNGTLELQFIDCIINILFQKQRFIFNP